MTVNHSPELLAKVELLLKDNPKALNFIIGYNEMISLIDDNMDEVKSIDRQQTQTALANLVFTSEYWQQYGLQLRLVELTTNLTYYDSVRWEASGDDYLKQEAKCLSHCGYNMLFAVIMIEKGFEAARSISAEFRESCHRNHRNDPLINPLNII